MAAAIVAPQATLASAEQMGVHVKMVTGDQVAIAKEIARDLGLGTRILDADTLGDMSKKATDAQATAIEGADGFAQIFPELQCRGESRLLAASTITT